MRNWIVIIILFLSISEVKAIDIFTMREIYFKASINKRNYERFAQVTSQISLQDSPVLRCYKGVSIVMKSNYVLNPYEKFSYFKKGKSIIEQAVQDEPHNIEIRFLRFCVQNKCPIILGYKHDLENDKKFILSKLNSEKDSDLVQKIKQYLTHVK